MGTTSKTRLERLTRGELAKRCQINIETVRYYEQRGLIPKPLRSPANYRLYPPDSVRRVRFIKGAQDLGFTLKEIVELLSLRVSPRADCTHVRQRARAKITDIDEKILTLQAMREALSRLMKRCRDRGPITECPILDAMDREEGT